jgi:hypothetical protein
VIAGQRPTCIAGRGTGWGARIRTWDRGTKTRCLTTWLRPTECRLTQFRNERVTLSNGYAPRKLGASVIGKEIHKGDDREQCHEDDRDEPDDEGEDDDEDRERL